MFQKIMVPIDLAHSEKMGKALVTAAEIAQSHKAELCFVGVTSNTPGKIAHTPKEYAQKLETFAQEQGKSHGVAASSHAMTSHDPAVDLDKTLLAAVDETGCDLVVMATHTPGFSEHIWASHGGHLAQHAKASVFLVR
ncbi:nucleotide-binding universal stress UspA family protein [Litoreibacter meonggei]|uniref:Nucleotide-binding universal stress UspA family protein n=1 Tax=Litoreibacter meonggei TaxID=1049199 RepID=A0A497WT17_9RHOB|nr:universal stress protein [Litoreibacter meonggei]RLJ59958.1 nucleotide-binding universal stress UspA family protein [Litoreibacter meonggei]